jgi:threonylcarbamoyladenosine tRNA methylthiotransferase MtaB
MKTFSIKTLGCKVNQYETRQIEEFLEQSGLRNVKPSEKADLVVINTCCVTHTASAKSRRYIRRARRQNADAAVVVCGCLPTVELNELNNISKNVHIIGDRSVLACKLSRLAGNGCAASQLRSPQSGRNINSPIKAQNGSKIKFKKELMYHQKLPLLTSFKGHTRAFLKIQDGCDGYCTYCIVPKTRPFVRYKRSEQVLEEARALVKAGHREIVITGIFLGAYGQNSVRRKSWPGRENEHLANILDKTAEIPGLSRIRLSSLEPADLTEQLLDVFCRHRNIMPHLHLSLQSGSDSVLRRMCRQYSSDEFREKVELAGRYLDRPAITTDIIVGFPGETDDDFQRTVDLAGEVCFSRMHVFGFSAKKGTAAAKMDMQVSGNTIKERSRILHLLNEELGRKFRRRFIGESAEVVLESDNGRICGRSERYFMVHVEGARKSVRKNDLVRVKLLRDCKQGMCGHLL